VKRDPGRSGYDIDLVGARSRAGGRKNYAKQECVKQAP
jgi:hypothetical protein